MPHKRRGAAFKAAQRESIAMTVIIISSTLVFFAVLLACASAGSVWDKVTARYVADITPMLDSLSLDHSYLTKYLRIWGISLVAAFVIVAFVFGMPPVALAAVYLVYVSPRIILEFMIRRRRAVLRDQMVAATTALANTSRAGLSLAQGLETIGQETPDPLAAELRRIVHEYRHGRPLSEAIRATKERLKIESFTLFASAILVCLERGGRITEALERIGHSLQELQRIERKLEADTASGTKVVYLLTIFPLIFLGISYLINQEGTATLLHSISGQVILLFVIGLTYASFRWSQRILAIEV
jgi:tight adherence protein B